MPTKAMKGKHAVRDPSEQRIFMRGMRWISGGESAGPDLGESVMGSQPSQSPELPKAARRELPRAISAWDPKAGKPTQQPLAIENAKPR